MKEIIKTNNQGMEIVDVQYYNDDGSMRNVVIEDSKGRIAYTEVHYNPTFDYHGSEPHFYIEDELFFLKDFKTIN